MQNAISQLQQRANQNKEDIKDINSRIYGKFGENQSAIDINSQKTEVIINKIRKMEAELK